MSILSNYDSHLACPSGRLPKHKQSTFFVKPMLEVTLLIVLNILHPFTYPYLAQISTWSQTPPTIWDPPVYSAPESKQTIL